MTTNEPDMSSSQLFSCCGGSCNGTTCAQSIGSNWFIVCWWHELWLVDRWTAPKNSWNHWWKPMNMVLIQLILDLSISHGWTSFIARHRKDKQLPPQSIAVIEVGPFQEIIRLKSRNSRKLWATWSNYLLYVIHRDTCSIDRWLARIVSRDFMTFQTNLQ